MAQVLVVCTTPAAACPFKFSSWIAFAGRYMKHQNLHRYPQRLAAAGVLLLVATGSVPAQQAPHVCGAGPGPNETVAGVQPAGPGVAPTPLCYWKSGAQQPAAPQPTGYWEKTWGAIAPSPVGGVLGTAVGASSKEEAERIALEDCKTKGGGACEVEIAYHNQCAAMVLGKDNYRFASAASVSEASQVGLNMCKERGDSDCRVYYSACTKPIFHKY